MYHAKDVTSGPMKSSSTVAIQLMILLRELSGLHNSKNSRIQVHVIMPKKTNLIIVSFVAI